MPLADLGAVSTTLVTLLTNNVGRLLGGTAPTVTLAPPDRIVDLDLGMTPEVLSLHLFHFEEDSHFKNLPGAGAGQNVPDIATQPMGLKLFYVLTAHTNEQVTDFSGLSNTAFSVQHRLFGAAIKTLHDYPTVSDATEVISPDSLSRLPVMDAEIRGKDNRLEIFLRATRVEDSINFWSAEDRVGARLSAFYEVRVILLEPEKPQAAAAGVVLSVGNFVFVQGTPQLLCSRNKVGFILPTALPAPQSNSPRLLDASPARAALVAASMGDPWPPAALPSFSTLPADVEAALENNDKFTLVGGDLTRDVTRLVLRSQTFQPIAGTPSITVNPSLDPVNAAWYVDGSSTEFTFAAQTEVIVPGPQSIPIRPGVYMASLSVIRFIPQVGAVPRELGTLSNEVPVIITPQIERIDPGGGTNEYVLTVRGSYLSPDPGDIPAVEPPIDIQLFVGGVAYVHILTAPDTNERFGEPIFLTDSTITFTLTPELVAILNDVGFLAVRLVINGAEAPGAYLQVGGSP